jgi:hypothetical protein
VTHGSVTHLSVGSGAAGVRRASLCRERQGCAPRCMRPVKCRGPGIAAAAADDPPCSPSCLSLVSLARPSTPLPCLAPPCLPCFLACLQLRLAALPAPQDPEAPRAPVAAPLSLAAPPQVRCACCRCRCLLFCCLLLARPVAIAAARLNCCEIRVPSGGKGACHAQRLCGRGRVLQSQRVLLCGLLQSLRDPLPCGLLPGLCDSSGWLLAAGGCGHPAAQLPACPCSRACSLVPPRPSHSLCPAPVPLPLLLSPYPPLCSAPWYAPSPRRPPCLPFPRRPQPPPAAPARSLVGHAMGRAGGRRHAASVLLWRHAFECCRPNMCGAADSVSMARGPPILSHFIAVPAGSCCHVVSRLPRRSWGLGGR